MVDPENKLKGGPKTLYWVWFLKSSKERKKYIKENYFFIFNYLIINLSTNEASLSG